MTKDEQAQIAEYTRNLADLLGLRDWTITVRDRLVDDEDVSARIETVYGRKRAVIRMGIAWRSASPEEHRHTITHELLHCHFDAARVSLANFKCALGGMLYQVANDAQHDAIEYGVDAIADALAPYLPLPNEDVTEEAA